MWLSGQKGTVRKKGTDSLAGSVAGGQGKWLPTKREVISIGYKQEG